MKNHLVQVIGIAVVVGALGFYGGMTYQKTQTPMFTGRSGGQFARGQFPGGSGGPQGRNNQGFRPVNGTISTMDDKSVTVKLMDGSSKIILLNDSTKYNKTESTDKSSMTNGETITVIGTSNNDGSVTAETINLGVALFRGPDASPSAK